MTITVVNWRKGERLTFKLSAGQGNLQGRCRDQGHFGAQVLRLPVSSSDQDGEVVEYQFEHELMIQLLDRKIGGRQQRGSRDLHITHDRAGWALEKWRWFFRWLAATTTTELRFLVGSTGFCCVATRE